MKKDAKYDSGQAYASQEALLKMAERIAEGKPDDLSSEEQLDFLQLAQRLNLYHAELEAQNEELRKVSREYEASRRKYWDLFQFAPVCLVTLGNNGIVKSANIAATRILARPEGRLIGHLFSSFVLPEDHDKYFREIKNQSMRGETVFFELRLIDPAKNAIPVFLHASAKFDPEGQLDYWQLAFFDITDRKEAETALRESETKFRMLFSEMTSGCALGEIIFEHSDQPYDFRILNVNPALERITGLDKNQILSKRLLEVLPATEPYWIEKLGELALTGKPVYYENYHRQLDKYLAVSAFRTAANQIAITLTDVTDRKRFEMALQKANDELERLVEERTVELTKSNASLTREIAERRRLSYRLLSAQEDERRKIAFELHDELGQDLSLLKLQFDSLNRQLAKRKIALKDPVENLSAILVKTIEKVRRISHELIPSVLVDLGLTAALRWQIQLLKKHSSIEVSSNIHLSADLIPPEQQIVIYRVFQEIFTNIRKHSQAKRVSIDITSDDRKVYFGIEDDGIGFDFERINSMSADERGMGLGAMEERVKMLDGKFDILSRIGEGTRISFEIPVASPSQQTASGDGGEINEPISDYPGR